MVVDGTPVKLSSPLPADRGGRSVCAAGGHEADRVQEGGDATGGVPFFWAHTRKMAHVAASTRACEGGGVEVRLYVRSGGPVKRLARDRTRPFESRDEEPLARPCASLQSLQAELDHSQALYVKVTQDNSRLRLELKTKTKEHAAELNAVRWRLTEQHDRAVAEHAEAVRELRLQSALLGTELGRVERDAVLVGEERHSQTAVRLRDVETEVEEKDQLISDLLIDQSIMREDNRRLMETCELLQTDGARVRERSPPCAPPRAGPTDWRTIRSETDGVVEHIASMHRQLSQSQEAFQRSILAILANISLDAGSVPQAAKSKEDARRSSGTQTELRGGVNDGAMEIVKEVVAIATEVASACRSQQDWYESQIFHV